MHIEVVTGGDENYAWGIVAALRSAVVNTPASLSLTVLDLGLTTATRERLLAVLPTWPRVAGVRVLTPRLTDFEGLPAPAHFSIANYARLLLPDMLEARRVLYLDADVLVSSDVADLLLEAAAVGAPAAAVRDFAYPTLALGLPGEARRRGGRDDAKPYYNSGVMVMDLDQWRGRGLGGQILSWLEGHPGEVRFVDQDGINAVLGDEVHELTPTWNVQAGPAHTLLRRPADPRGATLTLPVADVLAGARIVHFVGGKPWAGQGLQANRTSIRSNIVWWRTLCGAGVFPSGALVRLASEAMAVGTAQARRQATRGRTASAVRRLGKGRRE